MLSTSHIPFALSAPLKRLIFLFFKCSVEPRTFGQDYLTLLLRLATPLSLILMF